ncbi:hypothetical protein [Kistimonas asteriae]|uniref:hypothetical protein n=1 Tax=Kistimonas asteriae TaxID=517724 RepID=UPI001BAA1389|nr:hypothetical protein [Kistimonas asteriae]
MAGLTVDQAGDVPNQMPPPKKRFGEFRALVGRKVAVLEEKWGKAKENADAKVAKVKGFVSRFKSRESSSGSNNNTRQGPGIFTISQRVGSPNTFPSSVGRSDDIETDSAEDVLATLPPESDVTAAHPGQISVTASRGNILETGSTGVGAGDTASTLTSGVYVTAQNSLVDTESTSGADTASVLLQTDMLGDTNADDRSLSVNNGQSSSDYPTLTAAVEDTVVSAVPSSIICASHLGTPEERHLKERPEACSDAGNASKDEDAEERARCLIEPEVVVHDASLEQPDTIPAAHLNSTDSPAVIPITVEGEGRGSTSSEAGEDIPFLHAVKANAGSSISHRSVVTDGVDEVITLSPDNGASPGGGSSPPESCGAMLWRRFKTAMSELGQLIGGLIDKLLALFNCTETSDDGPSGSGGGQRPSPSASIKDTGNKDKGPVQGNESPQGGAQAGKGKETDDAEGDQRRRAILAMQSLNSSYNSSLRQHESDNPHEASLCVELTSYRALDSLVVPMSTSRRSHAPCTPLEKDVGNSEVSSFQRVTTGDHQMRLENLEAEGHKSDVASDPAHCGEQTLEVSGPQGCEHTLDLIDDEGASLPRLSPSHSMDRLPTTSAHDDEMAGACGTQSGLGSLCSQAQLSQVERFTQRLNEEQRACFSSAIDEAREFFTDLIELNHHFQEVNKIKWYRRKSYAESKIQPVISTMNQRSVSMQEDCNRLFGLLNITDDHDKDIIVEAMLNSVFRETDPLKEGGSEKKGAVKMNSETLQFFVDKVQEFKNNKGLDDTCFVNVDITIGEAIGGPVGDAVAWLMPNFPHFTLAIDCRYGTLLRVLKGQRVSAALSRK